MFALVGVGRRFYLHVPTGDAIRLSYDEAVERLVALAREVLAEPDNGDLGPGDERLAQADIAVQEFLIVARDRVRPT